MFHLAHNLYKWLRVRGERRVTILIIGCDNAGKTSVLNSLKGGEYGDRKPERGPLSPPLPRTGPALPDGLTRARGATI